MRSAAADVDFKKRLEVAGLRVVTSTPEELSRIIADGIAKWSKLIKDAGIRTD
jgi:tripartite-type tricarboxylate transporter receptor subunit TctC